MADLGRTFQAQEASVDSEAAKAAYVAHREYERQIENVRTAAEGSRNNALNEAAFTIGRIVARGYIAEHDALAELNSVAADIGLRPWEVKRTIESGYNRGLDEPWEDDAPTAPAQAPTKPRETQPAKQEPRHKTAEAQAMYRRMVPVAGTASETYLRDHRGITIDPEPAGHDEQGGSLVCPLVNTDGTVTSVQRIIVGSDGNKRRKLSYGDTQDGVFLIEGDETCAVAEGPEDALTIRQETGWTVIATCGNGRLYQAAKHIPDGATVVVMHDNDPEQGKGAHKLTDALRDKLCKPVEIWPPREHKDVNAMLQAGLDVAEYLRGALEPEQAPAEPTEPSVVDNADITLPEPEGLLRDVRDHIVDSAQYQHRRLSLFAALHVISMAMGRRYEFDNNIRPNLYTIGLAPSSSGKNHVLKSVSRFLEDAGLEDLLAGSEPASGSAVRTRMLEHHTSIYLIDEFGMFAEGLADKRAPGHVKDITKVWTELYTSAADIFRDRDRAQNEGQARHVVQPHLNIFGITNESRIWKSVTPESISDGSLGRFLIVETEEAYPWPNFDTKSVKPSETLIEHVKAVRESAGSAATGNLQNATGQTDPALVEVVATDTARQMLKDIMLSEVRNKREHQETGYSAIYGRQTEMTKKLAMIHAVGRNYAAPMIEEKDVQWAYDTVRQLIAYTVYKMSINAAGSEHEADSQRVMQVIRAAGDDGVTKSQITRATRKLKPYERDQILQDLIEADMVQSCQVATNGRNKLRFFVKGSGSQ